MYCDTFSFASMCKIQNSIARMCLSHLISARSVSVLPFVSPALNQEACLRLGLHHHFSIQCESEKIIKWWGRGRGTRSGTRRGWEGGTRRRWGGGTRRGTRRVTRRVTSQKSERGKQKGLYRILKTLNMNWAALKTLKKSSFTAWKP